MSFINDYKYLDNSQRRFFIFDSKANHGVYEDLDFKEYHWDRTRFNKVRTGDFFLYRRPQKASEVKNQFYIYGAGIVGSLVDSTKEINRIKPVFANIEHGEKFIDPILQSDLETFRWEFKDRKDTWEHFFQQYGMNQITEGDFWNLMNLAETEFVENEVVESKLKQDVLQYRVENKKAEVNVRGSDQSEFSRKVKLNYQYRCAITGISKKEFLVASHIIPWAENENHRKNPNNGICLSSLLDKAFDKGYIAFDEKYKLCISAQAMGDPFLFAYLIQYKGKKINIPKEYLPDLNFLNWHYENIFLK